MKNNNIKRLDGKNKLITLTKKLEKDIISYCRDKNIESESELIRQAVAKYIYSDYEDETLKLQGLKQLNEKYLELRDMLNILFGYLKIMHVNILAYHPEIDLQFAEAAYNSANMRHDKVFNSFQDSLKNEPPFFERLLHKYYSDNNNG